MIDKIQSSIKSILYDRLTSPLYGAFIVSWLVWNWKILYLTLFVSEEKIEGTKIDFIVVNLSGVSQLVTYPLISTIILLTLIPFVSNGSYFLHLKFRNWRKKMKDEIENKQLLSLEKSMAIRQEISTLEEKLNKIVDSKNEEIKILNATIKSLELSNSKTDRESNIVSLKESNGDINIGFEEIAKSDTIDQFLKVQNELLSQNYIESSKLENLSEVILFDLVKVDSSNSKYVDLTETGKEFLKWYKINELKKSTDNK